MSKTNTIKPLDGFSKVPDAVVVSRGTAVQTHMTGNSNFPNPPVDLAVLKATVDRLSALMAEALDGSKKVIAEKNKQRKTAIQMLRLLGRYVEVTCQEDMATFQTSGFQPASTMKVVRLPLSEKIRKIEHGANSGQIAVWLQAFRDAASYEFRYAPAGSGGTLIPWTTQALVTVKAPVIVTGLTPGATHVFQARALAKDGYTDWSDSVTFICT